MKRDVVLQLLQDKKNISAYIIAATKIKELRASLQAMRDIFFEIEEDLPTNRVGNVSMHLREILDLTTIIANPEATMALRNQLEQYPDCQVARDSLRTLKRLTVTSHRVSIYVVMIAKNLEMDNINKCVPVSRGARRMLDEVLPSHLQKADTPLQGSEHGVQVA